MSLDIWVVFFYMLILLVFWILHLCLAVVAFLGVSLDCLSDTIIVSFVCNILYIFHILYNLLSLLTVFTFVMELLGKIHFIFINCSYKYSSGDAARDEHNVSCCDLWDRRDEWVIHSSSWDDCGGFKANMNFSLCGLLRLLALRVTTSGCHGLCWCSLLWQSPAAAVPADPILLCNLKSKLLLQGRQTLLPWQRLWDAGEDEGLLLLGRKQRENDFLK